MSTTWSEKKLQEMASGPRRSEIWPTLAAALLLVIASQGLLFLTGILAHIAWNCLIFGWRIL